MLGVDASCLVDEVEGMVDCVVSGDGRELCHLAVRPPLIRVDGRPWGYMASNYLAAFLEWTISI